MVELLVLQEEDEAEVRFQMPHLFIHREEDSEGGQSAVRIDADRVRSESLHPIARLLLDSLTRGNFSEAEQEDFEMQAASAFDLIVTQAGEVPMQIVKSPQDVPFALLVNGEAVESFSIEPGDQVELHFI